MALCQAAVQGAHGALCLARGELAETAQPESEECQHKQLGPVAVQGARALCLFGLLATVQQALALCLRVQAAVQAALALCLFYAREQVA